MQEPELNEQLVAAVKVGFTLQKSSLHAYCKKKHIDSGNIYRYLRGEINSNKAKKQRNQVIRASKIPSEIYQGLLGKSTEISQPTQSN
jgi:hypothetical protein